MGLNSNHFKNSLFFHLFTLLFFISFSSLDIVEYDPIIYWTLPHWCVYVGYTLCFLISVFSIVVVLTYGQQFGRVVALKWLKALLFGFVEDVFFVYPLLVSYTVDESQYRLQFLRICSNSNPIILCTFFILAC